MTQTVCQLPYSNNKAEKEEESESLGTQTIGVLSSYNDGRPYGPQHFQSAVTCDSR